MSAVDVLAVMERSANVLALKSSQTDAIELRQARAAVAELIREVSDTLESHPASPGYPDGPCLERDQRDLLQAALARVGGDQ